MPVGVTGPVAEAFVAVVDEARARSPRRSPGTHLLALLSQPEELAGQALAELGVSAKGSAHGSLSGSATRRHVRRVRLVLHRRPSASSSWRGRSQSASGLAASGPRYLARRGRAEGPAADLLARVRRRREQVRDQLAGMLVLEAPELSDRLRQRWPLATSRIKGSGRHERTAPSGVGREAMASRLAITRGAPGTALCWRGKRSRSRRRAR